MTVLVIGANGQLGSQVCAELVARGLTVRGSVRAPERGADLVNVETVIADLTQGEGIRPHLEGVDTVVLTANAATPRSTDRVRAFPAAMRRLVDQAEAVGVRRFVLVSVPRSAADHGKGYFDDRRGLEAQLQRSAMEQVVLRFGPFMDVWLALGGSNLPLRGEPHATVGRPSMIIRRIRRRTGLSVDERGVLWVPGDVDRLNAFIAIRDAARACADAVTRDDVVGRTYEIGGPELLTSRDVARLLTEALGKEVVAKGIPAGLFQFGSAMLRPIGGATADTFRLLRIVSQTETQYQPGGQLLDPEGLTTMAQFLAEKVALPSIVPFVP